MHKDRFCVSMATIPSSRWNELFEPKSSAQLDLEEAIAKVVYSIPPKRVEAVVDNSEDW